MIRTVLVPVLAAAALCLTGCGGDYRYGGKVYDIPESAVAAQKADLKRSLLGVSPVLNEQRLGGPLRVVVPTIKAVEDVTEVPSGLSNPSGQRFMLARLHHQEVTAVADVLRQLSLVDTVQVRASAIPVLMPAPEAMWQLTYQRVKNPAGWRWYLRMGNGRAVQLDIDDQQWRAAGGPEGYERLKDAIVAAAPAARKAATDDRLSAGDGWPVIDTGHGQFSCLATLKRDGQTWTGTLDGIEYTANGQAADGILDVSQVERVKTMMTQMMSSTLRAQSGGTIESASCVWSAQFGAGSVWNLVALMHLHEPGGNVRPMPLQVMVRGQNILVLGALGPPARLFLEGGGKPESLAALQGPLAMRGFFETLDPAVWGFLASAR
jgi:hypothetical protein